LLGHLDRDNAGRCGGGGPAVASTDVSSSLFPSSYLSSYLLDLGRGGCAGRSTSSESTYGGRPCL